MKHVNEPRPMLAEKNKVFRITLVISAFLSMIFLDQTGVAVTLASIQKQLMLSGSEIAWIMNAYLLTLSALLLLFARLSESLGIRNVFCAGITIFMLASIGCATATSGTWLIISRALQGVGASLGYATYLMILNNEVPANIRGRVLGTSGAFAAIFLALGPLIGGFFSSVISWHYLFWINIPICLACLYFFITACDNGMGKSNSLLADKLGLLMYLPAMTGVIFFLMEGPTFGWTSPYIVFSIIGSLLLSTAFIYHERQHSNPLIDIGLFKNKIFSASCMILFCNYACVTSIAFWALWLEQVLGYSPLITGLSLLPAGIPYIFSAKIAGQLYDSRGARLPLMIGSITFLVGFVVMTLVTPLMHYLWFMLGMLLVGVGWGFVRPCAILSGINSVPASHKSMASGIISTMRQLGAAVGFALIYAVISTYQNLSLSSIIRQHKLTLSEHQLNSLITHTQTNNSLLHLIHLIKDVHTQALSLGLAVISLLAILKLVLVMKYIIKNQVSDLAQ